MTRGRHASRTADALSVSTLLARELAGPTEPAMRPVEAPGQRRRAKFDADGRLVAEPFPVFSGDLPQPCTRFSALVDPTTLGAGALLCGGDTEELLAPALTHLHDHDLLLGQQPPAPHAGERVGHHRAATAPRFPRALPGAQGTVAAPSTAPDDGPPTGRGGRDRCSPAPGAPVPHPDTSTGRTPDPAGRGESRGQRADEQALAAAGPRRAS